MNITFSTNSLEQAGVILAALKAAAINAEAAQPVQEPLASAPVVASAPESPAPVASATAAPLTAPTTVQAATAPGTTPRRGRGRPRNDATPTTTAANGVPVFLEPTPAPAVAPVTPRTESPAPAAGPVNLFAAPAAASPESAPQVAPAATGVTAPAAVKSVAQGAAIGLKPEQRQALFAQVYAMKPDGPMKAIALVKMFGVARVPDLHQDTLAEFDTLAAQTLHGTFDPRNGRPE